MRLLVERAFQLSEPRFDQLEFLDGADAFVSNRGMRRLAPDAQPEREGAGLRRNDPQSGGFQNDGGIGPVAALGHGEGTDPTVFFAYNALDDETAAQWNTTLLQGRRRADADRQPGLHVTGAPAKEPTGLDVRRPGRRLPGLPVAHRDHA